MLNRSYYYVSGTACEMKKPMNGIDMQFAGTTRQENAGSDPLVFDMWHNTSLIIHDRFLAAG